MSIVICILVLFATLAVGFPVAISLGFSGIIGLIAHGGYSSALLNIGNIAFNQTYGYTLIAILGFVLMGELFLVHLIGRDLYDTAYKWLGHTKGGLAIASTVMGALFGFMCGSSSAGAAVVGGVSIPEMEKYRYNRRLSLGTVATAGSLAILIPPSNGMIIYGMITETSIGRVFIGGILPGLLLATLMCLYIYIRARLDPTLAPGGPAERWKPKFKSLAKLSPVLIMFVVIIGGIYMGVWSAIEAGAASAVVALIICLVYRRVSWRTFRQAGLATVKTSVMIYVIIIGAGLFSYFVYVSGASDLIKNLVFVIELPPWGVMIAILFILMVLGCFMDGIALTLITVPLFLQTIIALGYDPVWFGIIFMLFSEMCLITPPVGVNLFIIKGIAPAGTTLKDVAIGAAPFVGIIWFETILLMIWPQIVLWLPGQMIGR